MEQSGLSLNKYLVDLLKHTIIDTIANYQERTNQQINNNNSKYPRDT